MVTKDIKTPSVVIYIAICLSIFIMIIMDKVSLPSLFQGIKAGVNKEKYFTTQKYIMKLLKLISQCFKLVTQISASQENRE